MRPSHLRTRVVRTRSQRGAFSTPKAFLLAISTALSGCAERRSDNVDAARPARVMVVKQNGDVIDRTFPGRARAAQEVNLAFRISGPMIEFPVEVGQSVHAGEVLGRVDPRDFVISLRNAEGLLQRAVANRERAHADLDRNLNIQRENPGAIAQTTIDQSREALGVAEAEITAFEASVDAAHDALRDTALRAPFSGRVVATYLDNFETVVAGRPVLRLLDTSRIEFEIQVPESLISVTPRVTGITVTYDAFPDRPIPAVIDEVGSEASETTRTFPITLIMDQPEGIEVLPGMAGRAKADSIRRVRDAAERIIVPVSAVFAGPGEAEHRVWVVDPTTGTVSAREIVVSEVLSVGLAVQSGVTPGEMIVTAGTHYLREGQRVTPEVDP